MDVSFVETMRGTLKAASGEASSVEFDVVAEAHSLRRFLRDGKTELRGLVRAPTWVDEAPAKGTLTLSPSLLEYRVAFTARDGRELLLVGQKHPSVFKLLTSMTEMETVLEDAKGAELARGAMYFDLRELPPFLLSWLPVGRWAQRSLDARRRAAERRAMEGGR